MSKWWMFAYSESIRTGIAIVVRMDVFSAMMTQLVSDLRTSRGPTARSAKVTFGDFPQLGQVELGLGPTDVLATRRPMFARRRRRREDNEKIQVAEVLSC